MREILFRGKRKDNGQWVEGFFCNETCDNIFSPLYEQANIIKKGTGFWHPVDSATVGQYTGVTDKSGKKIFEGDIVEYNGRRYCTKYYPPFAMYMFSRKNCGTNGTLIPLHECVVIGNIHDNPGLLEEVQ